MIQLSNAFSDAVVATVCIVVFFKFFAYVPFHNRLLWGVFLVTVSLAAGAGVFRYLGFHQLTDTHRSLSTLAGSAGLASVVVAIWGLVMRQTISRPTVIVTLSFGLILFIFLLYPAFQVFSSVVQAFTMLVVMLIAVFGLMQKYQKAIWIVIGVMILGIATKVATQHLPFSPIDVYHYALAAMVFCFGKAV
ncbi:DUF6962 family protein [Runella aurantiaca]|uniref:Uncharacterized protein n=1 Tax=Runella aurantiaca TaxID=2282308 RepID=A0A369IA84_9BACT|nr:hypothetical protein [Runella aurantiaca]RDB06659.1 hypothetical protein DVG78_07930 [Runella aurantiaca]